MTFKQVDTLIQKELSYSFYIKKQCDVPTLNTITAPEETFPNLSGEPSASPFDIKFEIPDLGENPAPVKQETPLLSFQELSRSTIRPSTMSVMTEHNSVRTLPEVIPPPELPPKEDVSSSLQLRTKDSIFSYLAVTAVVVDPRCELSAQIITIPVTTYYSYSTTPFFLKCPNMQCHSKCYCKTNVFRKCKHRKITGRYEFFSDSPFLSVEPSCGTIENGDDLKIYLILRPTLSPEEIIQHAHYLKSLEAARANTAFIKPSALRGSRRSRAVFELKEPEEVGPSPALIFKAKTDILKHRGPKEFETMVMCLVETTVNDDPDSTRKDVLQLQVSSIITRPDILVLTPPKYSQVFKFDKTAVGLKRQKTFEILNTSGTAKYVTHSLLNPSNVFRIPLRMAPNVLLPENSIKYGVLLEPDHRINVPVTFTPATPGQTFQYFQVKTDHTTVHLDLEGFGVTSRFIVRPKFTISELISNNGIPSNFAITIQNNCDAELTFEMTKILVKERYLSELEVVEFSKSKQMLKTKPNEAVKETRASVYKTRRSKREARQSNTSTESLKEADLLRMSEFDELYQPVDPHLENFFFSVPDEADVPPQSTQTFNVIFHPMGPRSMKSKARNSIRPNTRSSKKKKKSSDAQDELDFNTKKDALNRQIVCKVHLTLGPGIHVANWWFVGRSTKIIKGRSDALAR